MNWTADELRMIFEVALAEPVGLTPNPAFLPTAEALVKRGVLVRLMVGSEPVYLASQRFREQARALATHQAEASEQGSLN